MGHDHIVQESGSAYIFGGVRERVCRLRGVIYKGKLKIRSEFPQNIFVSFTGPITYNHWVIPGQSTQQIRVGNYKYKYWADGKRYGGSVNIPKKGNTLIVEPPKVCSCSGNIYNCADFKTQYQAQQC